MIDVRRVRTEADSRIVEGYEVNKREEENILSPVNYTRNIRGLRLADNVRVCAGLEKRPFSEQCLFKPPSPA